MLSGGVSTYRPWKRPQWKHGASFRTAAITVNPRAPWPPPGAGRRPVTGATQRGDTDLVRTFTRALSPLARSALPMPCIDRRGEDRQQLGSHGQGNVLPRAGDLQLREGAINRERARSVIDDALELRRSALRFAGHFRNCRRFANAARLPASVRGPVERPPWNRQRPLPRALALQGMPVLRLCAPQRRCFNRAYCWGCAWA